MLGAEIPRRGSGWRFIMVALLLSCLAACGQKAQGPTPPVLKLPRPGVRLVATPDHGPACGANRLHVHFDWFVSAPQTTDTFELRVDSPIGVVFASGHREGHADTGDWVHVGQWFFLVASETREVIAAVRIGPDDCI